MGAAAAAGRRELVEMVHVRSDQGKEDQDLDDTPRPRLPLPPPRRLPLIMEEGGRDMAAATRAGGCQIEVHPFPGLRPGTGGNDKVKIVMPRLGPGDEGQVRFLPMGSGPGFWQAAFFVKGLQLA